MKLKPGLYDSKMLKVSDLWDACQGEFQTECRQPRRGKCVTCSTTEKEQSSKSIGSRCEYIVSGIWFAEVLLSFIQYFPSMPQFFSFGHGNICSVLLFVGYTQFVYFINYSLLF